MRSPVQLFNYQGNCCIFIHLSFASFACWADFKISDLRLTIKNSDFGEISQVEIVNLQSSIVLFFTGIQRAYIDFGMGVLPTATKFFLQRGLCCLYWHSGNYRA
jgi:hypothetical protein